MYPIPTKIRKDTKDCLLSYYVSPVCAQKQAPGMFITCALYTANGIYLILISLKLFKLIKVHHSWFFDSDLFNEIKCTKEGNYLQKSPFMCLKVHDGWFF